MPTGFTSEIYSGKKVEAKDFILQCARQFGALVTMRDEPFDAEIPVFEPSSYHQRQIELAKSKLEKYSNMSLEEAEVETNKDYDYAISSYHTRLKEKDDLKARYEEVLEQVKLWNPPSDDHAPLKEYAVDQLVKSIEFDCSTKYIAPPTKESSKAYLMAKVSDALRDIEYHEKGWKEEVERTNGRNLWVKQLKDSL